MRYTGTHEEQQRQYEEALRQYEAERDAAMAEAGVAIGDTVEYHLVGLYDVKIRKGVLYLTKGGQPKVKCGKKVTPGIRGIEKFKKIKKLKKLKFLAKADDSISSK